jgi:hypothetical protein
MSRDASCELNAADDVRVDSQAVTAAQLRLQEDTDGHWERGQTRRCMTGPKPPKARHGGSGPALHQSTLFFFFLSPKSGARTMACKRLYESDMGNHSAD